jgi:murein DD-endopeptidase MepM/ murein hydrolase activator NlpD
MSLAALIERLTGSEHRTIAVTRPALLAGAAALLLLAVWAAGTAWYFLFQDDIAAGLLARQSAMQRAYEEKIGGLRVHLERLASQNLLDQDGLDKRVADLSARQTLLETRQAFLGRLSESSLAGAGVSPPPSERDPSVSAVPAPPRPSVGGVYAPEPAKPMPVPESFDLRLRGRESDASKGRPSALPKPLLQHRLAEVQNSLGVIEGEQVQALDRLLRSAESRAAHLRGAVREAGLNPDALDTPLPTGGTGGPFVPLTGSRGGSFELMADRVQTSIQRLDHLGRAVVALPFGRPMPAEADWTSGFGYRIDPFTRGPAMHTGLDFRAEYGAAVRATGAGQVVAAEYAGGYGNMVEIDHGNGVATRYAHLSAIAVSPGQSVEPGAVLGRAGSTGRSTGPHLHYETRIDGEAIDPQRFLRAGARLEALRQASR